MPLLFLATQQLSTRPYNLNDLKNPNLLDKELRAVFIRCFAHLMQGYEYLINAL
jgi:hypothetical protein